MLQTEAKTASRSPQRVAVASTSSSKVKATVMLLA